MAFRNIGAGQVAVQKSPQTSRDPEAIAEIIREVIRCEADALHSLLDHIDDEYAAAVGLIIDCKGKIVATGVGKSGLVARKLAATMSSTGTPAMFLHPAEALHGDLGAVSRGDVVIAIGKSGESEEVLEILPSLRRIGTPIIAITSNRRSALAADADLVLYAGEGKEACPFDLAPTSSTTVAMAIGDALAMAAMRCRNFQPSDFALLHPGGKLGKKLLLRVADLMIPAQRLPILHPDHANIEDLIGALTSFALGIVLFSRDGLHLDGILTEGDLRRILGKHKERIFELQLSTVINTNPITLAPEIMAVDALKFMEARERPLNVIPVVLADGKIAGLVRLHEFMVVA